MTLRLRPKEMCVAPGPTPRSLNSPALAIPLVLLTGHPTIPSSDLWTTLWGALDHIAAVITILGLPYLIVSSRRRVPRFSFDFSSGNREFFSRDAIDFCRFTFTGSVRNQSLDPNSIQRTHLVVWQNKRRKSTLRFGFGATINENGEQRLEPIHFDPREGKKLSIVFEVPLTGTSDAHLARDFTPIKTGSPYSLPTYAYELAFEDISGNLFDQRGTLLNRKGIDLRWTIGNQVQRLQGGNPFPFLSHFTRIYVSDFVAFIRRSIRRLGI
jgi:hypothetical protein